MIKVANNLNALYAAKATVKSANRFLNTGAGITAGLLLGRLLGGAAPDNLENPRVGITKGEWNSGGSAAGSAIGALAGGGLGYLLGPKDEETKDNKKKKQAAR